MPQTSPAERFARLGEHMLGLLRVAGTIADAVRAEASITMPSVLDQPEPESGPLEMKGFGEHFSYVEEGQISHCILTYRDAEDGSKLHTMAQHHMHALTGRILELNRYCQQAQLDEALAVALQAPHIRPLIDAILAQCAFFAGLVDTLAADADRSIVDPVRQDPKANFDRFILMAEDKMLAPATLDDLLPVRGWPVTLAMMPIPPHDGDFFLNGVYFPESEARGLLEAAEVSEAAA